MCNMADNKDNNNNPYDEFKGYFPEGLDLSPEELEREIEIENKQRAIALNMTAVKKDEDEERSISADRDNSKAPKRAPVNDFHSKENDAELSAAKPAAVKAEKKEWTPPAAEEITQNELLNKFEPLDDLLDELEAEDELKDDSSVERMRSKVDWAFDFIEVFTVCMACIILVFSFFARLTKVDGPSMEDTLQNGQYLIISDFAYTPKAGDIVVLQNTSLDKRLTHPLVKRIIATAGQSVRVDEDGTVTITEADGTVHELDQSFTKDEEYRRSPYSCEVPEGYVFVMGDNRNNSTDSRDPKVGLVDERCIFGRAVLRVLPLGEFTVFKNPYNN